MDEHLNEGSEKSREERKARAKKTPVAECYNLAQEDGVQKLIAAFRAARPGGTVVADLEKLLRTAIFKPAAQLIGQLLQEAADQPKPGEIRNGRRSLEIQSIFDFFTLLREYYYHPGKRYGHPPGDDALG